jgi:molybdopterin synthase sulfur carrier subunit
VLARSSFLVDGDPAKRPDHPAIRLDDGAVVEVLPPFAGG